jgi:hypothetical protein
MQKRRGRPHREHWSSWGCRIEDSRETDPLLLLQLHAWVLDVGCWLLHPGLCRSSATCAVNSDFGWSLDYDVGGRGGGGPRAQRHVCQAFPGDLQFYPCTATPSLDLLLALIPSPVASTSGRSCALYKQAMLLLYYANEHDPEDERSLQCTSPRSAI